MNRGSTIRWYVLKEFLRRFIPSLIVLFFIFVLQTFWVYFDELAGKGLSMGTIFKFFYYFSPNILLYSMPLAILIAGLMTYGSLGENNELAAIKSSGMSVWQSMRYLLYFNLLLGLLVIFIANTLQPVGNLKFTRLRVAIAHKMPAAVIREGRFSKIGKFNIKVEKKYGPNKNKLRDVIIHQKVQGVPDKVIIAEKGEFVQDEPHQILQLHLYNGQYYEDLTRQQRTSRDRQQLPALDSRFKSYIINIDISKFNKLKESKGGMRIYHMLNLHELQQSIDSLRLMKAQHLAALQKEIRQRHLISNDHKKIVAIWPFLNNKKNFSPSDLNSILSRARSKAQVNLNFLKRKQRYNREQEVFLNKYIHAFHEKISLPFYIFLLFLVGIPLGAIIRKGGFGLPFIFGLLIYTTFYMLSMLGKSMAEDGIIPPWSGAWLPVIVILPLTLYLIWITNRQSEFKMPWTGGRLAKWAAKWERRRSKEVDTVILPQTPAQTPQWALNRYPLKQGVLYYRAHETDFDRFFAFLQQIIDQYQQPYVLAYWKPDDDFRRRHGILGEVLMIRLTPENHLILTNLNIAYRYRDGRFELVRGAGETFVPYKNFL